MTHQNENAERIAELNTLFMTLDTKGQDSALTILRALEFAQNVMCSKELPEQPNTSSEKDKNTFD